MSQVLTVCLGWAPAASNWHTSPASRHRDRSASCMYTILVIYITNAFKALILGHFDNASFAHSSLTSVYAWRMLTCFVFSPHNYYGNGNG